jgi:hypothetical protein
LNPFLFFVHLVPAIWLLEQSHALNPEIADSIYCLTDVSTKVMLTVILTNSTSLGMLASQTQGGKTCDGISGGHVVGSCVNNSEEKIPTQLNIGSERLVEGMVPAA